MFDGPSVPSNTLLGALIMLQLLLLILGLLLVVYWSARLLVTRSKLVRYISKNYPILYGQLEIGIGASKGESMVVDGKQFHSWLLNSEYEQLKDNNLSNLAVSFKTIRVKSISLIFLGLALFLISLNI